MNIRNAISQKLNIYTYDKLAVEYKINARRLVLESEIKAFKNSIEERKKLSLHFKINNNSFNHLIYARNFLKKIENIDYLEKFILSNICHFTDSGVYIKYCS